MNGNKYNALAKAMYEAILQHGETILEKKKFAKIVKDLNGFLDMPETEKIIKILVNRGTLKRLYSIRNEKSIMISELICFEGNNLKQNFKYSDDCLVDVFNAIMSAFEGVDNGYLDKENKMLKDIEISSEIKEMTTETTIEVMPVPTDINDEIHENVLDKVEEKPINWLHISNIEFENYYGGACSPRTVIKWIKDKLQGDRIHETYFNQREAFCTSCWDPHMEKTITIYALDTRHVYFDGCEILIDYCNCKTVSELRKGDYIRMIIDYLDKSYGTPSVVINCDMNEYLDYLEYWEMSKPTNAPMYKYELKLRAYSNFHGTILCRLEFTYGLYSLQLHLTPSFCESMEESSWRSNGKVNFGVVYPISRYPYVTNICPPINKAISPKE